MLDRMQRVIRSWLVLALLGGTAALRGDKIGDIEFYGYKGLDPAKVRAALPIHEGGEYSDKVKEQVREAVTRAIGKPPSDVAIVCCDEKSRRLVFIGLPGESLKKLTYNPQPEGKEKLPKEIFDLRGRVDEGLFNLIRNNTPGRNEDDSNGYFLVNDPAVRALQMQFHDWAVQHEAEVLSVLEHSASRDDRRVASEAAGYIGQSGEQIQALTRATRDVDEDVRNNATRALGVLLRSKAKVAAQIAPDNFIAMLSSGTWSDRNKGGMVLFQMTETRDSELLAKIRASAMDALIEMSKWRRFNHAFMSRLILGRVAGLPEDRIKMLAMNGPVSEIVDAATKR